MRRKEESVDLKNSGVSVRFLLVLGLNFIFLLYVFGQSGQKGLSTPMTSHQGDRAGVTALQVHHLQEKRHHGGQGRGGAQEEDSYLYFVATIILNQGEHPE